MRRVITLVLFRRVPKMELKINPKAETSEKCLFFLVQAPESIGVACPIANAVPRVMKAKAFPCPLPPGGKGMNERTR